MAIGALIERDIITAMKAKDSLKLTTLRMVKSSLKNKEIDKREPLTEAEEQQILNTMIKQRKDSAEQFTRGGRPELAERELAEIEIIEGYLPKRSSDEEILAIVETVITLLTDSGTKPGPKDMGIAMKLVRENIVRHGLNADNQRVSAILRAELAKG